MRECYQTREFKQPEPVSRYEHEKLAPMTFDNKENKVNLRRCKKKQFYDASICRHLCSMSLVLKSKSTSPINKCEEICFELTKSSKSSGKICPYQKYCPNGCPCKHYACEKITDKDQVAIPVWDLESKTRKKGQHIDESIFQRREDLKRRPNSAGFNVKLYDYISKNFEEVFVDQGALFPHVAGAAFLNGEHFLIDAKGQMRVFSSLRNEILTMPFRDRY